MTHDRPGLDHSAARPAADRSQRRHRQDLHAGDAVRAPGDRAAPAGRAGPRRDLYRSRHQGIARAAARPPAAGAGLHRCTGRRCRHGRGAGIDAGADRCRHGRRGPRRAAPAPAFRRRGHGPGADPDDPRLLPAGPGRSRTGGRAAAGRAQPGGKRGGIARRSRDGLLAAARAGRDARAPPARPLDVAGGPGGQPARAARGRGAVAHAGAGQQQRRGRPGAGEATFVCRLRSTR